MSFMFLSFYSFSQKSILEKTIQVNSVQTKFSPLNQKKEIENLFALVVEPVDARSLNVAMNNSKQLDGNYSYVSEYEYKQFIKNGGLSKRDIKLKESLTNFFQKIDDLKNNSKLTPQECELFKEKLYQSMVLQKEDWGSNGDDNTDSREDLISFANPYKINGKYLSVFKLTFENKSNKIQEVNLADFQISSNDELLSPFSVEYFEGLYRENPSNQEKLKSMYRYNMPVKLKVLNNQPVTKYFSTPAINTDNKSVIVNYIKNENAYSFTYSIDVNEEKFIHKLTEYKVDYTPFSSLYYRRMSIVLFEEGPVILKGENIFIDDKYLNKEISVLTLDVDVNRKAIKLIKTDFIPAQLKKRKIVVKN